MSESREISSLVSTFVEDLIVIIEGDVRTRVGAAFMAINGGTVPKRRGRPPSILTESKKPNPLRRKGPIQLCPVPGCKNRAAPVFGMVCSDHKDLPKAKIKAFRDARKAKIIGKPLASAPSPKSKRKGITLSKKPVKKTPAKKPVKK